MAGELVEADPPNIEAPPPDPPKEELAAAAVVVDDLPNSPSHRKPIVNLTLSSIGGFWTDISKCSVGGKTK